MKEKYHKILGCELIKVEKLHNQVKPSQFYYNFQLEGFDEPLVVESDIAFEVNPTGLKIKYKLDSDGRVTEFGFAE